MFASGVVSQYDACSLISCVVGGEKRVDELGQQIFELMLATASGSMSKSEQHGYGQNEFVPWQIGAIT